MRVKVTITYFTEIDASDYEEVESEEDEETRPMTDEELVEAHEEMLYDDFHALMLELECAVPSIDVEQVA